MSYRKYNMNKVFAFDYETRLMGPQCLAPDTICFSVANKEQGAFLISDGDKNYQEYIRSLILHAKEDEEVTIVCHNSKYDMHCLVREHEDLYHTVIDLYKNGQIIDTILIEKLINLTTTGRIDSEPPRDPTDENAKGRKINYALSDLILTYTGKDVKESKEAADAVRTRYQEMSGTPSAYYPKDFKDYSIADSTYLLEILEQQFEKRDYIIDSQGFDPLKTLSHRCALDFALYRFSIEGVRTNEEQIKNLEKMLGEELCYDKLNLLYPEYILEGDDWNDFEKVDVYLKRDRERAFLKPSYPKRPAFSWAHKKGCPKNKDEFGLYTCGPECFRREARQHSPDCKPAKRYCKFTKQPICDCPPKYVQAEENKTIGSGEEKEFVLDDNGEKIPIQKDKLNTKRLQRHIVDLWFNNPGDYEIHFSEGAYDKGNYVDPDLIQYDAYKEGISPIEKAYEAVLKNVGSVSVGSEWMEIYAFKDPILAQYAHRASLIRLQNTEIPRMKDRITGEIAEVVHGNFDVLKETGRTSGFADKLYPSANLQNVHKMARSCFKARPGHWILSTDYSSLEFVAAAQRAWDRLGRSVYKTIFDNGWDAHGYLAAQRAYRSEAWFQDECRENGLRPDDHEEIYHRFHAYKGPNDIKIGVDSKTGYDKKFHKFYRNSAKPIGLGILGGMGPKTIAHVSAATYKIEMSIEDAEEYKAIWEEIFEPEATLVKMINKNNKDPMFSTRDKSKFKYETPMGMVRPNCSFAACSNGDLLQSPSAEGMMLSIIQVSTDCYDPESTSFLKGNFKPWAAIHDEVCGDVIADPVIATAVAKELERVMCENLNKICPDIKCSADSALMIVWDKRAEDFYNEDGHLVPWETTHNKELATELNALKNYKEKE